METGERAALKQVEKKRKDIIKKYRQLTARMDQIVEEAGTHFDEKEIRRSTWFPISGRWRNWTVN